MYANDSPLHGSEGTSYTISQLRERLIKESQNDVALRIDGEKKNNRFVKVVGRGDLHLGVLFERMRREGMEFMVSPPQIITKTIDGAMFEPVERVNIEIDEIFEKGVIEKFQSRKATLFASDKIIKGNKATVRLTFDISSRGFIGFRSELLSETRGTAIIRSEFLKYEKFKGSIHRNVRGAIISLTEGKVTSYALADIEKKGTIFIEPGNMVYPGVVIGEHTLDSDVEMNPCKQKRVTNVRTHNHEERISLAPPKKFTIDEALTYIREDEIVEVTPKNVRIRKKTLDMQQRRRLKKEAFNAEKLAAAESKDDE